MLGVIPSLRACKARPSRGTIQGKMASWGKTQRGRERQFSRRDALCASVWYGRPDARGLRSDPMCRRTAGGLPGTCLGQTRPFLRGRAEPAPPRGGGSQARWPSGINARGRQRGSRLMDKCSGQAERVFGGVGRSPRKKAGGPEPVGKSRLPIWSERGFRATINWVKRHGSF